MFTVSLCDCDMYISLMSQSNLAKNIQLKTIHNSFQTVEFVIQVTILK